MLCWRCTNREERSSLGLCHECRDELHAEILIPPGPTLLPPATPPEQIPGYRPPGPADYHATLIAP